MKACNMTYVDVCTYDIYLYILYIQIYCVYVCEVSLNFWGYQCLASCLTACNTCLNVPMSQ